MDEALNGGGDQVTCQRCARQIVNPAYAGRGGRRYCGPCRADVRRERDAARQRKRRASADYKAKYRADELRRKYGLTPATFAALLEVQGGRCAVCSSDDAKWYRGWHVDHDHETGEVRGILCQPCNLLLGLGEDSSARLRKAADYLDGKLKPPGWQKPSMAEAIK